MDTYEDLRTQLREQAWFLPREEPQEGIILASEALSPQKNIPFIVYHAPVTDIGITVTPRNYTLASAPGMEGQSDEKE